VTLSTGAEYIIRLGNNDSAQGWEDLCRSVTGNTRRCLNEPDYPCRGIPKKSNEIAEITSRSSFPVDIRMAQLYHLQQTVGRMIAWGDSWLVRLATPEISA
jgi:hypothetical protein